MPPPFPTQIADPGPTPPIAAEVRRWLIRIERGAAEDIARGSTSPGAHKVWRWPDISERDTDTRHGLKAWVWCQAHGHSSKDICRQRVGWSVRIGQPKVDEAVALIAARLAFETAGGGEGALVVENALAPVNMKC